MSIQFDSYTPYQVFGTSTQHIQYALANNNLDKYKQIDARTYNSITAKLTEIQRLNTSRYISSLNIHEIMKHKRESVQKMCATRSAEYARATKELEQFQDAYKYIFEERRKIQESNTRLSWIILGTTQESLLNKHDRKYADIYKQLNDLQKKVSMLANYAPDRIHKTMVNVLDAERSNLEYSQRQELEQYEREKQKKLNKLHNEINIIKSGRYDYVVCSVTITTNMSVCKITGIRHPLDVSEFTKKTNGSFVHTIINKPVEITR